ncbi:19295_t:CDS:2, partial [Gigaspora margarita]
CSNSSLIETTNNINVELDISIANEVLNILGDDFELLVKDSYLSWDLAKVYLNNYAKAKGFSLRQKMVETNNNSKVNKIEILENIVLWHINLSKPKALAVVIITSIIREHNHQMQLDIALYAPKYRKLPLEMIEKIEFYVMKSIIENNSESISLNQPDQIIVMDPLVTKHCEQPITKILKSFSKYQSYKASIHSHHTINSQDSNLRIPLAPLLNNDSNNSHALNNNTEKPCNESKRKYLCN